VAERGLGRRAFSAALAGAALAGCGRARGCGGERAAPAAEVAAGLGSRVFDFDGGSGGPQKALVIWPTWGAAGERFPLLVALHGRGESNHGLDVGAWGWVRDYWLDRTMARLRRPPLDRAALLGITSDEHLARLNGALAKQPFRGLVVACPYTPDILGTNDLRAAEPFARFVADSLVPRVRAELPVIGAREATGIDGVSLGGRVALLAGFARPEVFGAVGTLQAAVRPGESESIAALAKGATTGAQGAQRVRLLTSEDDPFMPTLGALASAMAVAGIGVDYRVVPGPHDYDFNRGPGGYEMLLWHDRVLRGETPA
jgi:hypothetical protein